VALGKERWLVLNEFVGDGEDGFLAERNGMNQAATVADLVAEKLARLGVGAGPADHILVEIIDSQIRQVLAGEARIPHAVIVAFDDDVG